MRSGCAWRPKGRTKPTGRLVMLPPARMPEPSAAEGHPNDTGLRQERARWHLKTQRWQVRRRLLSSADQSEGASESSAGLRKEAASRRHGLAGCSHMGQR